MRDNSEYHERQQGLIAELIRVRQDLVGAIYESAPGLFEKKLEEHSQREDENLATVAGSLLDKLNQNELTEEQVSDALDRYFVGNKFYDELRETATFYQKVLEKEAGDLDLKTEKNRDKLTAFNKKEELTALVQQWDGVLDQLFGAVFGLVKSLAFQYSGKKYGIERSSDYLDYLVQEGSVGLRRCMKQFDPYKGVLLSFFAYNHIRNSLVDAVRTGSTVDLPRNMISFIGRENKTRNKIFQQLGREPADEEVAAALNMNLKDYTSRMISYHQRVSLSQPVGREEEGSGLDFLEDVNARPLNDSCDEEELKNGIFECLSLLTPREQDVIRIKWLDNNGKINNVAVGQILEISKAAVSKLELSAFEKLRRSGKVEYLRKLFLEQ